MAMDLARKEYTNSPDYLIASANIKITTAIKEAAADLATGAPVKLDSNGKAAKITSSSDTPYGIVTDSTKSGDDAVIYLTGEFFADALVYETGITAADLEVGFRNIGIFLKDGGPAF